MANSISHGIAVDGSGKVYVADSSNHRIQKLIQTAHFWPRGEAMAQGMVNSNFPMA